MGGGDKFKEWAYKKAAWEIDELKDNILDIYIKKKGAMDYY